MYKGGNHGLSKAEIDFNDLQFEIAGVDVGRIPRFLPKDMEHIRSGNQKTEKQQLSALDIAMLNPSYAALYNQANDVLSQAEQAVIEALQWLDEQLDAVQNKLDDMLDKAHTLPDGTKVFKGADGKTYTQDGRELTPEEMDSVDWKDNAPSWEDYQDGKKTKTRLQQDKDDVIYYRDRVLQPARTKLDDPLHPLSDDDLKIIIKGTPDQMPPTVHSFFADKQAQNIGGIKLHESKSAFGDTGLNAPDVKTAFNTARMDIPDLDLEPGPVPDFKPH